MSGSSGARDKGLQRLTAENRFTLNCGNPAYCDCNTDGQSFWCIL